MSGFERFILITNGFGPAAALAQRWGWRAVRDWQGERLERADGLSVAVVEGRQTFLDHRGVKSLVCVPRGTALGQRLAQRIEALRAAGAIAVTAEPETLRTAMLPAGDAARVRP